MRSRLVAVVSMVLVALAGGAVAVFAASGPKPSPAPVQNGTTKNTDVPVVTKPGTTTVLVSGRTAAPALSLPKPDVGTFRGGDKPTEIPVVTKPVPTVTLAVTTTGAKAPPTQGDSKTTTIEVPPSPKSGQTFQTAPATTAASPAVLPTTTKAAPPTSTGGDKPTEPRKVGKPLQAP